MTNTEELKCKISKSIMAGVDCIHIAHHLEPKNTRKTLNKAHHIATKKNNQKCKPGWSAETSIHTYPNRKYTWLPQNKTKSGYL